MKYEINQFEEFKAPSGRVTPLVTFGPGGSLYLSSALTQMYGLNEKNYPAVKLYYNKIGKIIAIKPLKSKEEGSINLKSGEHGGAFINSRAFAIKYEMDEKKAGEGFKLKDTYMGKYDVSEEDISGMGKVFVINLGNKRK